MAWLTGYGLGVGYRSKLTIDHNEVPSGATLSNFTKTFVFTADPGLIAHCDRAGASLRVTSSNGTTELDFGIVYKDIASGNLVIAVNVTTIDNTSDKELYLYFKRGLADGLLLEWKLDESSGSRASVEGGVTLADNNTVSSGTGLIYSNAADFESSNSEFLDAGDTALLSSGDNDITYEVWIKPESLPGTVMALISKHNGSTIAGSEFLLQIDAASKAKIEVYSGSSSSGYTVSANAISTGVWTQIIWWHDSVNNEIGLAINAGTPAIASWTYGLNDTATPFALGALSIGSLCFDGLMQSCRKWGRVLSSAERRELYASGAGRTSTYINGGFSNGEDKANAVDSAMVAFVPCQDVPTGGVTSGDIKDWTSNANHLSSNAYLDSSNLVSGLIGNAYNMDIDGFNPAAAQYPNITSYFSTEASYSMLVKKDSNAYDIAATSGSWSGVSHATNSNHYRYADGIYDGCFIPASGRQTIGAGGLDTSAWHHVCITSKPGTNNWKYYQNGTQTWQADPNSTVTIDNPAYLTTGAQGYVLGGKVQHARLANVARSAAWVAYEAKDLTDNASTFTQDTIERDEVPWLSGYGSGAGYRKTLTIDHSVPTGTLTSNTRMLFVFDGDADLTAHCDSSGNSIRVTMGDGQTELDFGIVTKDISSGDLILEVAVPTIDNVSDKVLYLYYKSSGSNGEDRVGVSGSVLGNWHFEEVPTSSGALLDWSNNNNHLTLPNGTSGDSITGQIGKQIRTYNGSATFIALPDLTATDWTIRLIGKQQSPDDLSSVIAWDNYPSSPRDEILFRGYSSAAFRIEMNVGGTGSSVTDLTATPTNRNHIVLRRSGTTIQIYVNGTAVGSSVTVGSGSVTYQNGRIGSHYYSGLEHEAEEVEADELIIDDTTAWTTHDIYFDYVNRMLNASTFSVGDEEQQAGGVSSIAGVIANVFTLTDTIRGSGALLGSASNTFAGTNTITGSGSLAGVVVNSFAATDVLVGAGQLAGAVANVFSGTNSLTASGQLAGAIANAFTSTDTITATGTLAGTSANTFTSTNFLQGLVDIAGTLALAFGAGNSTLSTSTSLSGTSTLVFSGTNTVTATGQLSGTADSLFGGTNSLTASGQLAGASANVFVLSDTLTASGQLSGTATNTFTLTDTLTAAGQLSGSSTNTFDSTPFLQGLVDIAGVISSVFGYGSSTLTGLGAGSAAGTAVVGFSVVATLVGSGQLSGSAVNTFAGAPFLQGWVNISGIAANIFSGTNTITASGQLAGSATNTFTLSVTTTAYSQISGVSASVFTSDNTLIGHGQLSGIATESFTLTASSSSTVNISGISSLTFTTTLQTGIHVALEDFGFTVVSALDLDFTVQSQLEFSFTVEPE